VPRAGIAGAFAAICLVWGSVYLAVRFAIETLPPFLMVGSRMAFAGLLLYAWARWRGAAAPTVEHWRSAVMIGALVIVAGSGGVAWAQQRVPSGLTALLVATEPFWLVLLDWWWHGGERPPARVALGIALGFAGVALLVAPGRITSSAPVNLVGAAAILGSSIAWAAGSLYSRHAPLPISVLLGIAMQMFAGGVLLLVAGTLTSEWPRVNLAGVSLRSWLAYGYLLVFATLITFPAYIWLLRHVSAARVSLYAYVNPVVAVFLGWALAGETLNERALAAAAIIIASVVLVISRGRRKEPARAGREEEPARLDAIPPVPEP
jgi:drug/metabolite transporter (DMT)-like permease